MKGKREVGKVGVVDGLFGTAVPGGFCRDGRRLVKTAKKVRKIYFNSGKSRAVFAKMKEIHGKRKPHLESDITLPDLAKRLAISTHHLSQSSMKTATKPFRVCQLLYG